MIKFQNVRFATVLLAMSLAGCSGTENELKELAKVNMLNPQAAKFGDFEQGSAGDNEYACLRA